MVLNSLNKSKSISKIEKLILEYRNNKKSKNNIVRDDKKIINDGNYSLSEVNNNNYEIKYNKNIVPNGKGLILKENNLHKNINLNNSKLKLSVEESGLLKGINKKGLTKVGKKIILKGGIVVKKINTSGSYKIIKPANKLIINSYKELEEGIIFLREKSFKSNLLRIKSYISDIVELNLKQPEKKESGILKENLSEDRKILKQKREKIRKKSNKKGTRRKND